MQHVSDIRQGTVVSGHQHAYTGRYLHFRAVYAASATNIDWLATISFQGEPIDELSGSESIEGVVVSPLKVVKAAVSAAIDRRDFFSATGPGSLKNH